MRRRYKIIVLILITLFFLINYYCGLFERMCEKNFYTEFYYPYDVDIQRLFYQFEHNETPYEAPINIYNYNFLTKCEHKCKTSNGLNLKLVLLVKSALANIHHRDAIRKTWGKEDRFPGVDIARVFLLGTSSDAKLMHDIKTESNNHKDIVQANFVDNYYNNTIKTMTGFRWALSYCPHSEFYMFADDDMYVSMKNVLSYIHDPFNYPNSTNTPYVKRLVKRDLRIENTKTQTQNNELNKSYQVKVYQQSNSNSVRIRKYHQNKLHTSINPNSYKSIQNEEIKTRKSPWIYEFHNNRYPLKLNKSEKQQIVSYIKRGGWNQEEIQKTDKFPINNLQVQEIHRKTLEHTNHDQTKLSKRKRRHIANANLFDNVFYGGHVDEARPIRDKGSKWYISLEEYPYNRWPLFAPAGTYILSHKALRLMYYMSMYTKHFRFDDIFLGLVAFKAGIKLHHCAEIHNNKKPYDPKGYQHVIASHGYGDVDEFLKVWNEQRILKNA